MEWQNIDLEHGHVYVHQHKTGKEVLIPIATQPQEAFLEAREWRTNQYACPNTAARYNQTNCLWKNTGNNMVNIDVLRMIRWIGLEPWVDEPGRDKKMKVYGSCHITIPAFLHAPKLKKIQRLQIASFPQLMGHVESRRNKLWIS